ncbi:unnamed protein product, partial [Prorocentrum cordatum]
DWGAGRSSAAEWSGGGGPKEAAEPAARHAAEPAADPVGSLGDGRALRGGAAGSSAQERRGQAGAAAGSGAESHDSGGGGGWGGGGGGGWGGSWGGSAGRGGARGGADASWQSGGGASWWSGSSWGVGGGGGGGGRGGGGGGGGRGSDWWSGGGVDGGGGSGGRAKGGRWQAEGEGKAARVPWDEGDRLLPSGCGAGAEAPWAQQQSQNQAALLEQQAQQQVLEAAAWQRLTSEKLQAEWAAEEQRKRGDRLEVQLKIATGELERLRQQLLQRPVRGELPPAGAPEGRAAESIGDLKGALLSGVLSHAPPDAAANAGGLQVICPEAALIFGCAPPCHCRWSCSPLGRKPGPCCASAPAAARPGALRRSCRTASRWGRRTRAAGAAPLWAP